MAQAPQKNIILGLTLRLVAIVALAVMFALVKLAAAAGVHVIESLFWRQVAGLPVVILWLWWMGSLSDIRTGRLGAHALRMFLGISAMMLNFLAMTLLPMAEASAIGFAVPIFATILAALLLKEPTGRYRWGAIFLGFAGILLVVQPGHNQILLIGAAVAIAGAIVTAAVTIQLRRLTRTEPTGAIVFWFSLSSLIPLGIAMLFFGKSHDGVAIAYIAGLSLAGAVAQILLTASLRHAPVAAALTMDYTAILWSTLLGFFIFGDIPGLSVFIGTPVIIIAGIIILWREHHLSQQREYLPE
jgi:drug/metabolite transporter (DMT)-like permease